MSVPSRRASARVASSFLVAAFLAVTAPGALAATFTVNEDGSATDLTGGTGACATTNGGCSFHAAIQSVNAQGPGPHTIAFSIAKVTLAANLPTILVPVTIDGGGSRTEIVGGPGPGPGAFGSIILGSTSGTSTVKNLVIGYMSGAGIAIIDGGKTVQNCRIGTDTTGTIAHPNSGAGITVTTTALGPYPVPVPPPVQPPDISAVLPTLVGHASDAALGNLISGNQGLGVDISGERTVKVTVANNLIGTDAAGTAAIPNGLGGVRIVGNAFANTIGPGNVISGNASPVADGVAIGGKVWEPNVVKGNIIGPAKDLSTNLGHWRTAIVVDSTRYDPKYPEQVATLGPGNVLGYALEDGVSITGGCEKVQLFGNFIGLAQDPNDANSWIPMGNGRDGVRIGTSGVSPTDPATNGHLIGGTTAQDRNVISSNGTTMPPGGSGIHLATSSATNITIQGNVIGRDGVNLADHGNTRDGITITGGGNNVIGGVSPAAANVIAGNGRNGVKVTSGGNGWANLIRGNSIFGNHKLEDGLGIDLDYDQEGVDPADNSTPGPDPNTAYANYGQNAPVVGSGVNAPHYDPITGNLVVDWALDTAPSTPVLIQFFTNDAAGFSGNGEGRTFLGFIAVVTDGAGHAEGVAPVTPPSPLDSRGLYLTMTATATNPVADLPGPSTAGPANNTSEFSNAVQVPNPGVLQLSSAAYGVGEAGPTATITVTRTGGSDGAVSIDYAASNGTAGQPLDYLPASGTLNWADGDSVSKTFTVTIQNDTVFEGNETVNLALSNPGGYAELGPVDSAVLTIADNDPQPTISIGDASGLEGNAGTTPFTFTVSLSNASTQTVTVNFAAAAGSAATPEDFQASAGVVTFTPGVTSQPVVVLVNGDTTEEPDQNFFVNLSGPLNATILDGAGEGTIQNDDAPSPTFSVGDVTQSEGNAGTTTYAFTVNLTPPSASPETVTATTANGTATTADGDYDAKVQVLSFPAGVTAQTFSVTVNGDTKREPDETFAVALSLNSGTTILAPGAGTGTIQNDDPVPSITIDDVSALEGDVGPTPFTFTVSLSNPTAQTVTVNYATADGTATVANADYVAASGVLTIPAGTSSAPLTVNVNGDTTDENLESFAVNLTNGVNAGISDTQGQGSIQNDDSTTPSFSIASVSQAEGNAGATTFTFTVSLSPAAAGPTSVTATTSDGSATTADSDYVSNAQLVSFPAGSTSQSFQVTVNGDTKNEPAETFTVTLSGASAGTTIGSPAATGTITNDDPVPSISIGDVSGLEGNAGSAPFGFTATLSNPSSQTVTVNYATADGTATTVGADYASAAGTLTFSPGVTTQPLTVNVNGDGTDEPDETFFVNLSSPSNATVGDPQAQGTILNDDSPTPTFSIANVSQAEGNAGTTIFTFTVSLSPASGSATGVTATTSDGSATTADGDYVASTQGLAFPIGSTSQTFQVTVNGDTKYEPTEAFAVALSGPTGGAAIGAGGTATGTITNDDVTPSISVDDVAALETNAGTTPFTFTVSLSNASYQTVTVDWVTANGTATTAGLDYAAAGGTLTFPPGVTTQPATVNVNGDTTDEPDETFFVNLSNPANATPGDVQGQGTIQNDDSPTPTFTIGNVSQAEGNAGTTVFTFTVNLAPAAGSTVSVQAATADGTAMAADGDYVPRTQTLTFSAGVTSQPFSVTVNGDGTFEPDEAFAVVLSAGSAGTAIGGGGTATGTITGDDPQPAISLANVSAPAAVVGSTTFTFTLTLSNPSSQPVTVSWATADGTASAAAGDYVAASGMVTFPPGTTTMTFSVTITTNATSGSPKTFFVNLSAPVNGTIATVQAVGTILPAVVQAEAVIPVLGGAGAALLALLLAGVGLFAIRRLG
ncbi:MAG: hypothetical protein IPL90_01620 [Holophagales bacterium]|nr:hypothetical protein [Holophagales bacterium]